MNLALGSWVMVGVCLGLPITPWACRTFGVFQVCSFCVLIDFLVILMMLWPGISLPQIYFVRFLVGFFEAPFLPYLQEWLARFGKHTWNVWNTVLHAMVPLGENMGYILAQELVAAGFSWQWAFGGQALVLALASIACYYVGGRKFLDLGSEKANALVDDDRTAGNGSNRSLDGSPTSDDPGPPDSEVEYPVTERWVVYWAVNASLAAQLGFLGGIKYVIRDYATRGMGYSLNFTLFTFSSIALIGPALGGSVAMSGNVVKPDKWSQHKRTLTFLACTSSVAACVAVMLPYMPDALFWPAMFVAFTAAGGVYPAAQGIINIALTATRVIEASVYQVQCNNIFFAMPMPYVIGKTMDLFGYETSFHAVVCLQILAAAGFVVAIVAATFTEERSTWHRLAYHQRGDGTDEQASDVELTQRGRQGGDFPEQDGHTEDPWC
eukprot:SRR837773.22095.p1 GENE.SRR837773.22095~~SRR837773.22095.p1  ORF type:complete len:473 (-),score=104.03 SRR837773.22095:78-1388(-)